MDSRYRLLQIVVDDCPRQHAGDWFVQELEDGQWVNRFGPFPSYEKQLAKRKLEDLQAEELPQLFDDI